MPANSSLYARDTDGSEAGEGRDCPVERFVVMGIFPVNAFRVVPGQLSADVAMNVCLGQPRCKTVTQAVK